MTDPDQDQTASLAAGMESLRSGSPMKVELS